jgi:hypothetical protein
MVFCAWKGHSGAPRMTVCDWKGGSGAPGDTVCDWKGGSGAPGDTVCDWERFETRTRTMRFLRHRILRGLNKKSTLAGEKLVCPIDLKRVMHLA